MPLASDAEKEAELIAGIVTALRAPAGDDEVRLFHMGANAARRIADLLDLGAAPKRHDLSSRIRDMLTLHDSVRLVMPIAYAGEIADLIEIGGIRRDAGVTTASGFRLN